MNCNILPNNTKAVQAVRNFEQWALTQPQIELNTEHSFWAGCYARTIMIPQGVCITGVQIKIDTLLIVSGDVMVGESRLTGYHVLEGNAGRKNAFLALEDTWLTMVFASDAKNVEHAENEFTDEAHILGSRKKGA